MPALWLRFFRLQSSPRAAPDHLVSSGFEPKRSTSQERHLATAPLHRQRSEAHCIALPCASMTVWPTLVFIPAACHLLFGLLLRDDTHDDFLAAASASHVHPDCCSMLRRYGMNRTYYLGPQSINVTTPLPRADPDNLGKSQAMCLVRRLQKPHRPCICTLLSTKCQT